MGESIKIFDFTVEGGQKAFAAFDNEIVYAGVDNFHLTRHNFYLLYMRLFKGLLLLSLFNFLYYHFFS